MSGTTPKKASRERGKQVFVTTKTHKRLLLESKNTGCKIGFLADSLIANGLNGGAK